MKSRRHFLALWTGAAAALLLGSTTQPAEAEGGPRDLAVVVAADSSIQSLTLYELKLLYKGDQLAGPGGKPFVPLNRGPNSPDRVVFDRSVLGMTPDAVARYWIDRKIRGQSGAPKAVDPAELVKKVVARLDGAISYVPAHQVAGGGVKVVAIDGKLPGSADYPIRY